MLVKVLLLVLAQRWLDHLERVVNILSRLGTRQHYLTGGENEQTNFRLFHVVN